MRQNSLHNYMAIIFSRYFMSNHTIHHIYINYLSVHLTSSTVEIYIFESTIKSNEETDIKMVAIFF